MKVTFLGTGTSVGVPAIACRCAVCTSADPRDKRLRSSVLLEDSGRCVLIDTSVDLRQQALSAGMTRLDGILYTHPHADHMLGLDEVRIFNFRQERAMDAYGSEATLAGIRRTFWYAFEDTPPGGGKPQVALHALESPGTVAGLPVQPFQIRHGVAAIQGYRIGEFAYITDCLEIPEESYAVLRGVKTLVINALRHKPHPTHQTVEQAVRAIERIAPETAWLTHMSHDLGHARTEAELPAGIRPAHDGLVLQV